MRGKIPVSAFGFKVLQKLDGPKGGVLLPDQRVKIGALVVPESLFRDFLSRDLVEIRKDQKVFLTDPGRKLSRRLFHLQKKAKNPRSLFPSDPYRAQHANYSVETRGVGKEMEKVVVNAGNTTLSWLFKRKDKNGQRLITRDHLEAGEKLSRDFEFAGSLPRTTGFYDGVPISGKTKGAWHDLSPSERQLAAKARVNSALKYVGPGLSDILVRVCCFNEGLEQAETHLAWPTRSGKLVLKIALDRLEEFYNPKK